MTAARAGRSKVAFSHECVALLLGQLDQQGEREDLIRHLSLHHVSSGYLALFCGGSRLLELYERLSPKEQVLIKSLIALH